MFKSNAAQIKAYRAFFPSLSSSKDHKPQGTFLWPSNSRQQPSQAKSLVTVRQAEYYANTVK